MPKTPSFMLDESAKYYTIAPGNIITGLHLKYLIACLNSKIFYFALRKFYMGGGIEGELKTNRLLILPIPSPLKIETNYVHDIETICSKIVSNPGEDSNLTRLLDQIDQILIEMLKLSKEEYNYICLQQF